MKKYHELSPIISELFIYYFDLHNITYIIKHVVC